METEDQKNKQHHIAVISLDTNDFKHWKSKNNLKEDDIMTSRKFKIGNVTYYRILKVCDLCSLTIDEIIETERAKENKEYERIKLTSNFNLKTQT